MRLFGLLGEKLDHSFSPSYFADKFKELKLQEVSYEKFEIPSIGEVDKILSKADLVGFNVTIPYKSAIIPFLDELSPEAKAVGAVNTVKKQGEKWVGYNTDVIGFAKSIRPFFEPQHQRAIILGTGGASKAVAYALKGLGTQYIFVSRNPSGPQEISYDKLSKELIQSCPFIINTTPIGCFPNMEEAPNIPYEGIGPQHFLMDLIYNPTETKFLSSGKKRGATSLNGLQMLYFQADAAWEIWNS